MDLNLLNINDLGKEVQPIPEEVIEVFSSNEIEDYKEVFSLFDQSDTGFIDIVKIPRILLEIDKDLDKKALRDILEGYDEDGIDLNNFLLIAAKLYKRNVEEKDVVNAFKLLNPTCSTMPIHTFREMMLKSGDPLDNEEMTVLIDKVTQEQYDKYFNYESFANELTSQMEEYERILREKSLPDLTKPLKRTFKLPTKGHFKKSFPLKTIIPGPLTHFSTDSSNKGVEADEEDYEDIEDIDDDDIEKEPEIGQGQAIIEEVGKAQEKKEPRQLDDTDVSEQEDVRLRINIPTKFAQEQDSLFKTELMQEGEEEEEEQVEEEVVSEDDDYDNTDKYETEDDKDDVIEYDLPPSGLM